MNSCFIKFCLILKSQFLQRVLCLQREAVFILTVLSFVSRNERIFNITRDIRQSVGCGGWVESPQGLRTCAHHSVYLVYSGDRAFDIRFRVQVNTGMYMVDTGRPHLTSNLMSLPRFVRARRYHSTDSDIINVINV